MLYETGATLRVAVAGTYDDGRPDVGEDLASVGSPAGFAATFSVDDTGMFTSVWAHDHEGSTATEIHDLAISPNNGAVVVGQFDGTLLNAPYDANFDITDGTWDGFAARIEADGTRPWMQHMGPSGMPGTFETTRSVSIDSTGKMYVCGLHGTDVPFFSEVATKNGAALDAFVFNGTDVAMMHGGVHGAGNQACYSVGLSADESVLFIGGAFDDALTMFGVATTQTATLMDGLVVAVPADWSIAPAPVWWVTFEGSGDAEVYDVAGTPDGGVVVVGRFVDTTDVRLANTSDQTVVPGIATGEGNGDAFITMLGPDGTHRWTQTIGGTGFDIANAVAVDRSGHVIVVGHLDDGSAELDDFGVVFAQQHDAFVAELDPQGAFTWVQLLGGPDDDEAHDVSILEPEGNGGVRRIAVVGSFQGTANLGLGDVDSDGADDGFIVLIEGDSGCGSSD